MSRSKVPGTAVCGKCGGERDGANSCYCKRCFREYQREWRFQNGTAKRFVPREPVPDGMRRCSKCKACKPADLENFYGAARNKSGLMCWCKDCFSAHKRKPTRVFPTPEERFWAKVNKGGPVHPTLATRCWEWLGGRHPFGYGHIWIKERRAGMGAHVFSWELHNGPVPTGMFVLHKCDRASCSRPDHLFLGTQLENMRDKVSKGREARGERGGNAKYSAELVLEVRRLHASGFSRGEIERRTGVPRAYAYELATGRAWRHLHTKPRSA